MKYLQASTCLRPDVAESSLSISVVVYRGSSLSLLAVSLQRLLSLSTKLTAVDDSQFVGQLYLEIGNDEPPPEPEWNADPATRQEICSQITSSLYFRLQKMKAVNMNSERVYEKLKKKSKYHNFFEDLYERTSKRESFIKRPRHHQYVNPYRQKSVRVDGSVDNKYLPIIPRQEYVFLCLVKEPHSKAKIVYQVSKEYNVFIGQSTQRIAGRFVFKPPPASIQLVILAEEPARVDQDSNFNIEIYYLTLRRERMSEEYARDDPICKLIPSNLMLNQNHRICHSVLGSAHFKNEVMYVSRPQRLADCRKREVLFQTSEGQKEAARTGRYYEWMVYCLARRISDKAEVNFRISRAYKSGQVFVYRLVPPHYEAYLENLSTHVSIIDDGGKAADPSANDDYGASVSDDTVITELEENILSMRT